MVPARALRLFITGIGEGTSHAETTLTVDLPLGLAWAVTKQEGSARGNLLSSFFLSLGSLPKMRTADRVAGSPVPEAGNTYILGWRWSAW